VDHAFLILVLNEKGLPTLFEGGRMVVAGPAGLNDAARGGNAVGRWGADTCSAGRSRFALDPAIPLPHQCIATKS
jgi:hypothetical protein